MFAWLAEFRKIFVTGPQRSGTRIAAQMVAHDTGLKYVDEKAFSGDSLTSLWPLLSDDQPMVIQCPAACRWVHLFTAPENAVVLMRRAVDDIIASQNRIGWDREPSELIKYDLLDGTISEVKYRFWDETQRDLIHNPFEIEYESLSEHPMWISKPDRVGFRWDQTRRQQPQPRVFLPATFYRV